MKVSIKQLSIQSGVSTSMLTKFEKCENDISVSNFLKIISALGLEVNIIDKN